MAESGKLTTDTIEQKLVLFNSSQESVQQMSLWIMQHKAHHQKIVNTWLKVLNKSESKHKLTLFYLCNDVVQHAKKKKALYYLENFKDHLRDAVKAVREYDSIKPNIGRIFKIWEERKTYDSKFVKELRNILEGGSASKSSSASGTPSAVSPISYKPSSRSSKHRKERTKSEKESDKIIAEAVEGTPEISGEFKPSSFLNKMSDLKKIEGEVTLKAKQLAALRIDATNIEAVKQLKDRSHGNEFCRQFEESCVKIEDYVAMLEKEIKQRKVVLAVCDDAEHFYCTQFDEATVVANAYKNFGARVTNMKKRVDDMKKIIPATPSPVPSPTADAPSPGNSPPLLNMDDNETIDMDLCNEDTEPTKTDSVMPGRAYTSMVKSIAQPIASFTNIVMRQTEQPSQKEVNDGSSEFKGSDILESRIATMLPNLAKGNSALGGLVGGNIAGQPPDIYSAVSKPATQIPDVYTPPPRLDQTVPVAIEQRPTSVDDTGSSTPVLDEQEDKEPSPPPAKPVPEKKSSETKTKTNPIDFLSQLLTKTSSSSSSSNFLQTLSLLTNTVKTQYQKQESESADIPKPEEDAKPPSPTFAVGSSQSVAAEFTGVPPPVPSTQASSWSGWKQANTAQPDPSSPPIISQSKPSDLSHQPLPPLPPPLPLPPSEPMNPQNYSVQPPSPQDFSLPPPNMRPGVSQSFMNPPPPIPPPPISSTFHQVSSTQTFSSQPMVLSTSVPPTNLTTHRAGNGFNPGVPYGLPPAGSDPNLTRPPPPVSNQNQPGPGFLPRDNAWQPPRPPVPPTVSENMQFNQYAAPPPPPDSRIPPPWQPDRPENQPRNNGNTYNNQIAPIPTQRSEWNRHSSSSFEEQNWEPGNENQSSGYHHPWDEPHNFDEEDDDTEFADEILETTLPSAPKSILRNSRKSSLREVTLVEESGSSSVSSGTDTVVSVAPNYAPIIPQVRDQKPISILKKPTAENSAANSDSTQNEFINILKQKSGAASNLPEPPVNRNLSDISGSNIHGHGEPISTIGVLGNSGHPSSVKSDDMDIDNDDQQELSGSGNSANNWSINEQWGDNEHNVRHDFEPRDFNNSQPPPHWSEPQQRPWHSRPPVIDRGGFHQRGGFPPRPRFQDSYRGPSPAKRPYLPPRPRNPYYRY